MGTYREEMDSLNKDLKTLKGTLVDYQKNLHSAMVEVL